MHKMQGWSDAPLTDKGIADLEKTAQGLANTHFDAFYSSDLKRAMDTAEIIMQDNVASNPLPKLRLNPNFREVSFGIFEGIDDTEAAKIIGKPHGFSTFEEISDKYGMRGIRDFTKQADTSGFAENADDIYHRMELGITDLLNQNNDEDSILVVSHGGYIRMLADKYPVKGSSKVARLPENGSVTTLEITDNSVLITDFARPNDQL